MFGRGQGINYGGIPKLLAPEISFGGNFMFDSNGQYYSTTTNINENSLSLIMSHNLY